MINKIAFIGATGKLGRPVARQLIKAGFSVTALVRNMPAAKESLPPEIKLLQGDIRDTAALENSLNGQDALYINLNLMPGERKHDFHAESDGLAGIIQAATHAGIKRIAFVSSVVMNYQGMEGFNWWVFALKHEAVNKIRQSGIPYTIFYPSTFMENFKFTYRQGSKILLAGKSRHPMYYIAADDFGKQVARSFQILTRENKEYVIQGPEAFTADEAALLYVNNYPGEKISVSHAPLWLLALLGQFSAKINYGYHIVQALNNYPEKFESEKTWSELGKPVTTLKDFAALG